MIQTNSIYFIDLNKTKRQIEIMVTHKSTELQINYENKISIILSKRDKKKYRDLDERKRTLSLSILTKTFEVKGMEPKNFNIRRNYLFKYLLK